MKHLAAKEPDIVFNIWWRLPPFLTLELYDLTDNIIHKR